MSYATETSVPVEKSKMQIDALLAANGAQSRGIVVDDAGTAMIGFVMKGLKYRLTVPLPKIEKTPRDPRGGSRGWDEQHRADWLRKTWEQACRSQWRGMLLLLKAKFLAVEMGVTDVQKEFLSDLILPSGGTVLSELGKQISEALGSGKMPTLMLPEAR
jgi:hypothetical protein